MFADDKFKFNENDRKFSKQIENSDEKGEITRYEQFLLFPQCFQKTCMADTYKAGPVWERVKQVLKNVIKRAFGELNNLFRDEFIKFSSQMSTNVRFFLSNS